MRTPLVQSQHPGPNPKTRNLINAAQRNLLLDHLLLLLLFFHTSTKINTCGRPNGKLLAYMAKQILLAFPVQGFFGTTTLVLLASQTTKL